MFTLTSHLQLETWAVISERGCEAVELTHEEARRLAHRLESEGSHGLCIITTESAQRLGPVVNKPDLATARRD